MIKTPRKESKETRVSTNVTFLGTDVKRADTSRQLENVDEFASAPIKGVIISPPYDVVSLDNAFDRSNILKQCVAAYVTNIAKFGWDIVQASLDTPIDESERQELQSFIDRANSEESLTAVNSKIVEDHERKGYSFLEIIRDKSNKPSIFRHLKAMNTRLRPRDLVSIPVTYDIARGKRVVNVTEMRNFRTYVQIINGRYSYFKELGDPRRMDYRTGEFESKDNPVADENLATEVLHFRQNSEDSYGVPRWVGQLPSILGSRECEESNLRYFEDNTVPPMILTVAGGRLTAESYRELSNQLKQGVGRDRQHSIMLIEAIPETNGLDDKGNVSLKIDKLSDARQSDGLFKDYDESNQLKVMSSFRLGPILVGRSNDHDFSTATTAQFIAETQVFAPLRRDFDEIYNYRIINSPTGLGLKTVMLKSRGPNITNPTEQIKALTAANVMGAVTPRSAIDAVSKIMDITIPQYPEVGGEAYEDWMDKPLILGVALNMAAAKSQALQGTKSPDNKKIEATGNLHLPPKNGTQ